MERWVLNLEIVTSRFPCHSLNYDLGDERINMIKEEYKYSELTSKIIGCAMKVHSALGNGFQEVIYQRALEIEMQYEGLHFSREFEMHIYYRDKQIGTRRVDFLAEGKFPLR